MNNPKTAIQRQFNRSAAGSYDIHADVQRTMAAELAKSIIERNSRGKATEPKILEIGCGTGQFTELLLNQWPHVSITALDLAPAMIHTAEQRFKSRQSANIRFLQADVEIWAVEAPSDSFDLIVSNACFQWLSHPRQTISHLKRFLREGGSLVFTTFGPNTFLELHQAFAEVYHAYGMEPQRHGLSVLSTNQWEEVLAEAGFSTIYCQQDTQKETYASPRDFLRSIKSMGASHSEAIPIDGLSPRKLFNEMYKVYEEKFNMKDGIVATYEWLLIYAG
ncbi:malonyl-ACP O-methyltransferase BioC [Paenibacillus sp. JDR-2]|uniref:Malonyl-[acyl-carrier protein] O-methyltransferase n=1 Tax=Paenibacillus sp. (strain JDR-2) TaxID=324057 RepID=BIOC_PAESJ|nr:malonyl-ACP O-methyltransferase BioC [Paenibacillus sp. JDR-2]C6CWS7.1 RecName: Full=Malonyl-[acyl-carrier protein] O-methyltransferase; Short=Malonyl-ACP O-methyltransferase; AltName: Full=Biotin synthesis protein BioC [Paenibacillus sp. JDR-2]ACT00141.1 biotin biosynthesis protein BioC [Paenibacillus sp. JDR-2]